jgi:enamine deaminase RidA (YjgF/YER057c/UK114 family)
MVDAVNPPDLWQPFGPFSQIAIQGDIRREFFVAPFPVTTTIEVARLYDRALLVEISAIAEIPRSRFKHP